MNRQSAIDSLLSLKSGIIEFRSYTNKFVSHTYVPKKNPANNWFYGVPRLTKELKESGMPYVDPENPLDNPISHVTIRDGFQLDLSNENHRMILNWLVYCDGLKGLALTREEGIGTTNYDFYIYEEMSDLNRESKEFDDMFEAMRILKDTSDAVLVDYAKLLGQRFENKTSTYVRMYFQRLIKGEAKPKTFKDFLNIVNDKQKEVKLFLENLLDNDIIKFNSKTKFYKYEDIDLGRTKSEVITWLNEASSKNSVNHDLYITFREKTIR